MIISVLLLCIAITVAVSIRPIPRYLWTQYDGLCLYGDPNQAYTSDEASAICAANAANHVYVNSSDKHQTLQAYMSQYYPREPDFSIGIVFDKVSFKWKWKDGSSVQTPFFKSGSPDEVAQPYELCARYDLLQWEDSPCTDDHGFICERPCDENKRESLFEKEISSLVPLEILSESVDRTLTHCALLFMGSPDCLHIAHSIENICHLLAHGTNSPIDQTKYTLFLDVRLQR